MELSIEDDDDGNGEAVAATTHPSKGHKSTGQEGDDDEYGVSFWFSFCSFTC